MASCGTDSLSDFEDPPRGFETLKALAPLSTALYRTKTLVDRTKLLLQGQFIDLACGMQMHEQECVSPWLSELKVLTLS